MDEAHVEGWHWADPHVGLCSIGHVRKAHIGRDLHGHEPSYCRCNIAVHGDKSLLLQQDATHAAQRAFPCRAQSACPSIDLTAVQVSRLHALQEKTADVNGQVHLRACKPEVRCTCLDTSTVEEGLPEGGAHQEGCFGLWLLAEVRLVRALVWWLVDGTARHFAVLTDGVRSS